MTLPLVISGIKVRDFKASLKLAGIILLFNMVLYWIFGFLLKLANILTFGIGKVILNGVVLDVGSDIVDGIEIDSFKNAVIGALYLGITWTILAWLLV